MKNLITSIIFIFLASSCSYREVILRKAPDFLSDKIDEYLKLNDEQEAELRNRVTSSFFKHNKEVVELRGILANFDIQKDSLREQVKAGYPSYARILKDVNKISINILSKLSLEQRQELIIKHKENSKEADKEKRNKEYEERGVERLESVFGKLSPKQLDLVKKLVVEYQAIKSKHQGQDVWRKKFISTLEIKDQTAYKKAMKANFQDVASLSSVLKDNEYFFKFFDEFQKTLSKVQVTNYNKKKNEVLAWIDLYIKIYKLPIKDT